MEEHQNYRQKVKNKRLDEEGQAWLREDMKRLDLRMKQYNVDMDKMENRLKLIKT